MPKRRLILLLAVILCLPALAQNRFEFWPGSVYDPGIPTFKKVLGYEPGERISWHGHVVKYMEALAATSPRIKVFEYGETWEGRRLIYAVVASEANIRRLGEIRSGFQKLADPRRTTEAEAMKLAATLPAAVWLGYGIHGNEISPSDAALLTAYHLLAARNDKMVNEILAKTIVLIDPLQNPDGHDRFVHNFEQAEGLEPDGSPIAAERNEPWPAGRTNHYLFDMNRDWFALTQQETRGRVKTLQEWFPVVFVDLHEMGTDATYYFAPEAVPFNPLITKEQKGNLDWFGKNNARWFDHFGFRYFTREVFDAFYPGYGASWPSYYGSIAMTYEQASSRGLIARRTDDTVLHFRETVRHHFVASLSTAETAAARREQLLLGLYQYRRSAIDEGAKGKVREYVLPREGDTSAVDKLALLLAEQGVEVKRATAPFQAGGSECPAGSYVVDLAQPAGRLVRTLLDRDVPMAEEFLKEQERRRKKKLRDEIYDVTAWSLPLLFNAKVIAAAEPSQGNFEPLRGAPPAKVAAEKPSVAYLAPWGTAAAGRLLAAALREGLSVLSSDKTFVQDGRKYPSGTLIIPVRDNPPNLGETVAKLAAATGAEVTGTNTGWVDEGVNFGSNHVVPMRKPAIALAWDRPTSSYSAGWARFVLERQFGYPVTVVRTQQLASAGLNRFDVVVLPDGSGETYLSVIGDAGQKRLKDWVAAGGTLIGIEGAVSFLANPKVGLLAISQENKAKPGEAEKKPEKPEEKKTDSLRAPGKLLASDDDYQKAIQPEAPLPDSVQGVIVKAKLDSDHWLAAGGVETLNAMVTGPAIYTPIKLDKGVNVAVFAGPDELLQSGYMWEENRKQLAFKPLVVAQTEGRGVVIGFTADPNFRAYSDGMNVLFLNAVFRGPAHARPAP